MELKIQYAPLTSYQMDLVENRDKYEAKLRAVEQEYGLGGNQMLKLCGNRTYDMRKSVIMTKTCRLFEKLCPYTFHVPKSIITTTS